MTERESSRLAIDLAEEDHVEEENAVDVVEELIDQWSAPADLHYVCEGSDGHLLPVI